MPRRVELSLPPERDPHADATLPLLRERAARELRRRSAELGELRVERVSFDARPGRRRWRVSCRLWGAGEEPPPPPAREPPPIGRPPPDAPRAVVIGSGPAGLFCALDLLVGGVRVTLLERGGDVRARRRPIARIHRGQGVDPESNYCFGEGGAGTYSDGKLFTRSGDARAVRAVLEMLVRHGASPRILSSWRPHVGSNRLPEVVAAFRRTLVEAGADVRFGARAERIETASGAERRATAVVARTADRTERFPADAVVLATGHSALDSVRMALAAGARAEPKGFALGVRAEHPQPWLDARQYGGLRERCELPAAFYELATEVDGRGVYSFCMCPGGFIVPTTTSDARVVVNGMSLSRRDSPFANSGVVVAVEPEDWCGARGAAFGWSEVLVRAGALGTVELGAGADGALPARPGDDPLFGARIQLAIEALAARAGGGGARAPAERVDRFVEARGGAGGVLPASYRPGLRAAEIASLFPGEVARRLRAALPDFDARLPGFVSERGQLVGVETRTSSPVRLARDDERCESAGLAGLHPCGEGAGHAGGIVSAALDGRRVAAAILAGARV